MLVDLMTVVQAANVVLQAVFIVLVGLGYYYSVRATRVMEQSTQEMVQEMREERTTGGRPLITVSEDYESLPNLSLVVVQNVGHGPAKSISFSSAQVESSDGLVLSDLAIFWEGLTDLAPGAKILCYWDKLENLLPMIQEGRLEREISVTVEYQNLTGATTRTSGPSPPGAMKDS
jgi:hypothetical protein